MQYRIQDCNGTLSELEAVQTLLFKTYVAEGYTDPSRAMLIFSPPALKARGEIILACSEEGAIVGVVIFVKPPSPARQVAAWDEAEIHLLAVDPSARNRGIAARLLLECEKKATLAGFWKIILSTKPAMKAAHRLYEKHHYRRAPARDWTGPTGSPMLVYGKFSGPFS